MYDGMFIVGIETPDGQATYHYDIEPYWDMFECKELEYAPEWDGHTPAQAIARIGKLEPVRHGRWIFGELGPVGCDVNCSECGWGAKNVDPVMWLDYDGHKHCGCCGVKNALIIHMITAPTAARRWTVRRMAKAKIKKHPKCTKCGRPMCYEKYGYYMCWICGEWRSDNAAY